MDKVAQAETKRMRGLLPAALGTVIGVLAVIVVVTHLGGRSLPFVSDDRTAFILLAAIGMVMCAFGIQTLLQTSGLLSVGGGVGAVLGILVLIAFVMALLQRPMFLLPSYRSGFVALGLVMVVKWGVASASLVYKLAMK